MSKMNDAMAKELGKEVVNALLDGEEDNRQIVEFVVIGKLIDFEGDKPPTISIVVSDGLDWLQKSGLIHEALDMHRATGWTNYNDEGDIVNG